MTIIDNVLHYFAEQRKLQGQSVRCIQVGANDGKTNDPIYKYITGYQWSAILIEPQLYVFENELKPNYAGYDRVRFENVAISKDRGIVPFYTLSFTNSRWATGLASFIKSHLVFQIEQGYVERKAKKSGDTLPEDVDTYISSTPVRLDSFENIVKRNQFQGVDLLCIDTEGYDYEVLRLFDFEEWKPVVVLYESKCLSDEDFVDSMLLLRSHGYNLFWQDGNTLATKLKLPFFRKWAWRISAFLEKI